MNVYNRYYKQVKECPPSGTTEEEWYKIAVDNYRDAEGHAFPFLHCVEILQQLPKFNPMIDDADRSSDVVAEDSDADKKPAASVNKIGAPMGASLKRPPGSKKAKKELRLRDTSLSGSTAAGALVMGRISDSHNRIAAVFEKQTEQSNIKDQVSSVQVECAMHRDMGNDEAAMGCITRIQELQRELQALKNFKGAYTTTATNASTPSLMEDAPPVEEVDLTGEDIHLLSSEVDLTGENNVEVDDSEAEQDVEEMYTNGAEV
jgi:hypothetical protein